MRALDARVVVCVWARTRTLAAVVVAVVIAVLVAIPHAAHASTDVPVGTIVPVAGSTIPAGWLLANGQSTAGYPELAAIVGANVPDLRGRFLLGADGTYTPGSTGGSLDHTHSLASHFHPIASAGSHTHGFPAHDHTAPGHQHTNFHNMSVTVSGATHSHQNGGGRAFIVMGVTAGNMEFQLPTGGVPIRRSAITDTAGNHDHTFTGDIDGGARDGDANYTTGGAGGGLTSPATGAHAHGGNTGSNTATTAGANAPFQTFRFLIKASSTASQPCGAVWGTARATASPGAFLARGQALTRAAEPTLNGCLGPVTYPYGPGDGSTTFNLPNLQGRFPLGQTAAGTGSTLGGTGGSLDHTHAVNNHAHSVASDAGHTVTLPAHDHSAGHNHTAVLDTDATGAHSHAPNIAGDFVGEEDGGTTRSASGSRTYDVPIQTEWAGSHSATISGRVGRPSTASPAGVDGGSGSGYVTDPVSATSATGGSHDHGAATNATAGSTTAADPAFRTINHEINSSTATGPSVGTIVPWLGAGAPPAGWRVADGSELSQAAFPDLFAALGGTYGAASAGMFRIPDMQGRFPLGKTPAGTGAALNDAGGTMGHSHSAGHTHTTANQADHSHTGLGHVHSLAGHFHDFSRSANGGNHVHTINGAGNFWGNHLGGGNGPVANVQAGSGRNTATVNWTDSAWGGHGHSFDPGPSRAGPAAEPDTGNGVLNTLGTNGTTSDPGGLHAHAVDTPAATPTTSTADPAYYAVRYIIRVIPATIVDNQAGDTTWRNSNSGTYDVDFFEPGGLASLQTNVWSSTGQTGTERQAWTQFAAPGGTSYTANWSLAASTWTALAEGVNYVSVRMVTAGGQGMALADVFYVRKDTVAAAPGGINDGSGADVDWSTSAATIDANWTGSTGETGMSGVLRYEYCIATGAGCTGTVARTWTSTGTSTSVNATGLALANGTTYQVAVRMVDNAGNTSTASSSDGFTVDTGVPPAPTLVSPPDGSAHPSWAALTATYVDTAFVSPGQLAFEVCSDSGCGSVVGSGSSSAGIASGSNGSWTPGLANGTYWWRARSTDTAGNVGPWAVSRQVQVGSYALSVAAADVPLGTAPGGTSTVGTTSVNVSSNAINGYQLQLSDTSNTNGIGGVANVPDWTGTVAAPSVWGSGTTGYFGVSVLDAPGARDARWGTAGGPWPATDFVNNRFAGLTTTPQAVHIRSGFDPSNEAVVVAFRFAPTAVATPGAYSEVVTLTLVANP